MSATKGFFITGTDTDAGKTVASAAVLVSLRASGIDAVPMKAVQTGASSWKTAGTARIWTFACAWPNSHPIMTNFGTWRPYIYQPACSPHLAAARRDAKSRWIALSKHFALFSKDTTVWWWRAREACWRLFPKRPP